MIDNLLNIIEASRGWNVALLGLFSIALSVAASNFALSIRRAKNSTLADQLKRAAAQPVVRVLLELVRMGYYLGIPFAALYIGWLDVRSMGLGSLDWADGIRWAIVIVLAGWLLLMAIWLPYLRATADVPATPETQFSFPRRLVELVYMQAHWAFYRAVAIVFLPGDMRDALYWGAAIGLGFTALEALASPQIRERLTQIGAADGIVWNFGQAILNTFAFVVTRNLFLLLAIQFLLDLTVPHLRARTVPRNNLVPAPPDAHPVRE